MSGFDINTVTVSGHLCRDPELRNLPSGQSVCSLRIAHNERYKDASGEWADRTAYFDVTIWSGLGEWMGKNLSKGQKVVVSGRLRWREWEQDGNKRQAVDITADSVVPVVRDNGGGSGSGDGRSTRSDVPADLSDFQPPAPSGGGSSRPPADDDIPF
ncbi:MAG TPA: single-stranded DNA-binding protein [Solirubrobacteraceae bacterium]|jgi:single-strand DNA-binding protein|nr:single-stranded DNA-binding protein [Solirubrobacteraceae bacterium]